MPIVADVITQILLQGNPVALLHPSFQPTRPDSPGNAEARQPLPHGQEPLLGGGAVLLPPPPLFLLVMAFPALPGFRGLTPEGNLLGSSESSGVAEIIYSFGVSSGSPPSPLLPSARWSLAAPEGSDRQFPRIVLLELLSHPAPHPHLISVSPKASLSGWPRPGVSPHRLP